LATLDPPDPSGRALPERVRDPLGELFRTNNRPLFTMLIYLGASPQVAEDAIQEAFLELGRNWDSVRDPYPWVRRAAKTHFLKTCEKNRRAAWRERGLTEADHDVPDLSAEVAPSVWENQQWVGQLLRAMSPAAREVFELILEDYSRAEIAALLGTSTNVVRQRLHVGRGQVKAMLGPEYTIKDQKGEEAE
jgi:RNA polymerase sigma factor (sigma-70 family)